jgi:hypothetical protein
MKAYILSQRQWLDIRDRIRQEYGDTMILIRGRMQRELGFLPRRHRTPNNDYEIHIDFFTEESRTWFLIKYV